MVLEHLTGPSNQLTSIEGEVSFFFNQSLHNYFGPAVYNKEKVEYWVHGSLHNANGPAIIHADGTMEYWFKGKHFKTIKHYSDIP